MLGYVKEIANFFSIGVTPVQKQLLTLEEAGILVSESIGRSRVFRLNPQYPMIEELKALIDGPLQVYPADIKGKLIIGRSKPHRTEKASTKV